MKKFFPFIAIAFIAAVVLVSAIPDYHKSQEPINKFLSYAKKQGFAVGILTENEQGVEAAMAEIAKLEEQLGMTVHTKYYTGEEAIKMAGKQLLTVPAYLIGDGDGNLAYKLKGIVTAKSLVPYFADLHTH